MRGKGRGLLGGRLWEAAPSVSISLAHDNSIAKQRLLLDKRTKRIAMV